MRTSNPLILELVSAVTSTDVFLALWPCFSTRFTVILSCPGPMFPKRAFSSTCNTGRGFDASIRLCVRYPSLDVRPPAYLIEAHLDHGPRFCPFSRPYRARLTAKSLCPVSSLSSSGFIHDYAHLTTRSVPPFISTPPHFISPLIFATDILPSACAETQYRPSFHPVFHTSHLICPATVHFLAAQLLLTALLSLSGYRQILIA